MTWAMSSAAGAGNAVHGWAFTASSLTPTTTTSWRANRAASSPVVTAATGAASPIMNSIRASGTAGSIGKYAAPDFSTAKIATTASADRGNSTATHRPGPAP